MNLSVKRSEALYCLTCLLFFCMVLRAQDTTPPPASQSEPSTTTPGELSKPATVPEQTAVAGAPVDSTSYKIGPSDVLNVRVWHETEFSGPTVVHGDGKITLPLVGDLQAGGLTPVAVEKVIATALSKYLVNPLVTVTVQEVLSKKYYMDGEINRAGEYSLVAPTTILEAISKAGGLREFANEKHIYILRGSTRIAFNYKAVSHGKHMEQNIPLQSGDHVIVP
jgi:polysaccharide biosynthesis/export protein